MSAVLGVAAAAAILVWSPALAASTKVDGPLYAPAKLAQMQVAGVRLGMTLKEAEAALAAQGFAPRFPADPNPCDDQFGCESDGGQTYFTQRFGESVELSYRGVYGPDAVVLKVHYSEPRSGEASGAEAWRQSILGRYGRPSAWLQFISGGRISDRMAYVAAEDLKDDNNIGLLQQCTGSNWAYEKLHENVDCRPILSSHQQPVLTINFGALGVTYWLDDYGAIYTSMTRSRHFRDLDVEGYRDVPPPPIEN